MLDLHVLVAGRWLENIQGSVFYTDIISFVLFLSYGTMLSKKHDSAAETELLHNSKCSVGMMFVSVVTACFNPEEQTSVHKLILNIYFFESPKSSSLP